MNKKSLVILGIIISSVINMIGCGKNIASSETENSDFGEEVRETIIGTSEESEENVINSEWNVSKLSEKITDDVLLDADVIVPNGFDGTVEICDVKMIPFDQETDRTMLLPKVDPSEWEETSISLSI